MVRNQSRSALDALVIATAVLTAVFCSQLIPRACAADEVEGEVVQISPDANVVGRPQGDGTLVADDKATDDAPAYWLGIQGGPIDSPMLRTHLQLADDLGVAVAGVVPDSPAAKAGVKQNDIIIAVNGEALHDMQALQKAVADSAGKPVALKIIRLAKEEVVEVTPEERPADLAQKLPATGLPGQMRMNMPMGDLEDLMKQLQGGGFRMIGPGIVGNRAQANVAAIPGGVSVAIARQGDGPAKITVKKGDQTWEINGDDKEAIAELPEDVRPFVEQMLSGQGAGPAGLGQFQFQLPAPQALPNNLGQFNADFEEQARQFERANHDLQKRMEQMEKQLKQLNDQLKTGVPAAEADPSST